LLDEREEVFMAAGFVNSWTCSEHHGGVAAHQHVPHGSLVQFVRELPGTYGHANDA
jgi:hypothetical protein